MVKGVIRSRKYNVYCLSLYLRLLITPLTIVCYNIYSFWLHLWTLSVIIFTAYDYTFDHCIVCHYIYGFWLHLWTLSLSLCTNYFKKTSTNHLCLIPRVSNQKHSQLVKTRYFRFKYINWTLSGISQIKSILKSPSE
jgi:hypothetical protein